MMDCEKFIDRYTEYRDGLLSAGEQARFEQHLKGCPSCRRYGRVLTRGLALWRGLPPATTSPDFTPRLQHRLYHVDDAGKLSPRQHLGSAALVAVASVGLLAVTWLPFATRVSFEVELPAVAVELPAPQMLDRYPSLFDEGPYMMSDRFMAPMNPTLDEPVGLFATNYMVIPGDQALPAVSRRNGQLDEGR